MKKALIVGGGQIPSLQTINKYITESQMVIGADLGAEHLLLAGRIPDVVIGDMDSCANGVLAKLADAKCEIIEYPAEKSFSDLELAIDYAIEQGCDDITLMAVMHGRRIDHFVGNIFLLTKYAGSAVTVRMADDGGRFIQLITDQLPLKGRVGTYVSLIPFTQQVQGVTTTGLKYPLADATLDQGNTLGISNELAAVEALITIKSGQLLVIRESEH